MDSATGTSLSKADLATATAECPIGHQQRLSPPYSTRLLTRNIEKGILGDGVHPGQADTAQSHKASPKWPRHVPNLTLVAWWQGDHIRTHPS